MYGFESFLNWFNLVLSWDWAIGKDESIKYHWITTGRGVNLRVWWKNNINLRWKWRWSYFVAAKWRNWDMEHRTFFKMTIQMAVMNIQKLMIYKH